jgi:hypothetical protein
LSIVIDVGSEVWRNSLQVQQRRMALNEASC